MRKTDFSEEEITKSAKKFLRFPSVRCMSCNTMTSRAHVQWKKRKTHLTALDFFTPLKKQFLEMLISLEFLYNQLLPKLDKILCKVM